jgi:hypothetical protein
LAINVTGNNFLHTVSNHRAACYFPPTVRVSLLAVTSPQHAHESLYRYGKWFTVTNFYIYPVTDHVHSPVHGARPKFLLSYQMQGKAVYLVQQPSAFIRPVSGREVQVLQVLCSHFSQSNTIESIPTLSILMCLSGLK